MHVRRFAGLVPLNTEAAAKVVCPPYDVVTRKDAQELLSRDECAFLRVVRPDATLCDNLINDEEALVNAADEALTELEKGDLLVRQSTPSIFVYELRTGSHIQRGVACLVSIDDYSEGIIRRHEQTRIDKEMERAAIAEGICAHTGPVLLTYRDSKLISDAVACTVASGEAMLCVELDGVAHSVWRCDQETATVIERGFKDVSVAYIADGHHRAASANRVGINRRALAGTQMERKSDWFPAVLFPASELCSKPYYRVARDLGSIGSADEFRERVEKSNVKIIALPERPAVQTQSDGVVYMTMCENGQKDTVKWYALHLPRDDADEVDCQILQDRLLAPVLDVSDPRTDDRVGFVGGVGLCALERMVEKGEAVVGFAPCAVPVQVMMDIVDKGKMMPPKSTWFEPKLCSGFFVHTFSLTEKSVE